jgi:hypothetical protein
MNGRAVDDELHDAFHVVLRRAATIRRRRRAGLSTAVGGMAIVVMVAAGLARAGDPQSKLQLVGPPTTTAVGPQRLGTATTVAPITSSKDNVPAFPTTVAPDRSEVRCAVTDVRVTVSTDKTTYRPGETVRGVSTLENRSARTCILPTGAAFRIQNSAGRDVLGDAPDVSITTADPRGANWPGAPAAVEPGAVLKGTFHWASYDCKVHPPSGGACSVAFPPDAYTVTADWGGSMICPGCPPPGSDISGRTTFQLVS